MLEVCVDTLRGCEIAIEAGAQRIELSERLDVGGVTPSIELLRSVRSACELPLIVLIRNREGNFVYARNELDCMAAQARQAIQLGADGIAVGACDSQGELEWEFLARIAHESRSIVSTSSARANFELVVHRVFDTVPDPQSSLARLIELGYHRVLTSGGGKHATDSLDSLKEWQQQHGEKITILPAGGIHSGNAEFVMQSTGCRELHGSFTKSESGLVTEFPQPSEIRRVRALMPNSANLSRL